MKYILKFILIFISMMIVGTSNSEDWKNPNAKFDARKLMTNTSHITWHRVDHVQKTCERESKKRGFGGFNYPVYACSFWDNKTCDIFTSKTPTLHDVGHEVRHCFQGNFH
jgi:hypothetical protein